MNNRRGHKTARGLTIDFAARLYVITFRLYEALFPIVRIGFTFERRDTLRKILFHLDGAFGFGGRAAKMARLIKHPRV